MRTFISIVVFTILISCNNPGTQTIKGEQPKTAVIDTIKTNANNVNAVSSATAIIPKSTLPNLTVLVLPPYDIIANEGISPNIQNYIEGIFITDTAFRLIKFPYRQLMNVSYQNIFDKKYCSPITDKIKADIVIMSKIEQSKGTGNMATDKWNFKIKIYNSKTGSQKLSSLNTKNLTSSEIENLIKLKQQELFSEIKNQR